MYALYIGVGSVLLPLQIEHIDAASKVANLGLVVASAVVSFGGYPPLFLVGGLLSVLGGGRGCADSGGALTFSAGVSVGLWIFLLACQDQVISGHTERGCTATLLHS
ncbi:hypothetical protein ACFXG4_19740 [Nocardia sp. NPDC059246]|uniref:hypothetical protein n=1 Tax=unclassified Nocardia TaxID=2637762 RepID=UPI0036A5D29B